ncbi:helix-turn-helix transcriptional regulator [Paenibacillus sp. CC-CFT747]|nr:helix-turn-helix transcriptional regulator [Paenibacillus sp. CC-CFT747]
MANMLETNNRLADELKEKLPLLKENLLLQLLRGEISERDFAQQSSRNQLKLDGPVFLLCLFEVDQFAHFQERYWGRDRSLMMYSMSKVIAELAGEKQECWTVTPKPGQVALILSLPSFGEAPADEAESLCHQIRFHISLFLKFTVTAAITHPCYSRSRLHEAYQEGLDLLQYRMLLGGDITVQPEAVRQMPAIGQSTRMLIKRQKGIVKRIAEGRIDEASSEFEHFMQELPRVAPAAQSVIGIFTQLLAEVDHGLDELGLDLSELVSLKAYSRLMEAESLDAIKDWFEQEFFPALRSRYEKLSPSVAARLVQQVVEYIHNGAEQELSLQEAASRCGLSPSQLSRMFKEEKGCNFIDYVMECRMSKAKEWLAHTPMPIKEIAERLQYTNTQNFSRAFKQHTGYSPGSTASRPAEILALTAITPRSRAAKPGFCRSGRLVSPFADEYHALRSPRQKWIVYEAARLSLF